jgi:two-component system KDP operon response regulator KdpE
MTLTNAYPIVLVVDNDPDARQLLRTALSSGDYFLREVTTATAGIVQAEILRPALILTELNLPDMDGIEMIGRIRAKRRGSSIVVVSGRSPEQNPIVHALDAGADDYISKPFSMGELEARVRAALRRRGADRGANHYETVRAGELEVDLMRRRVLVAGREVHLTPLEYRMLSVLIANAGSVLTYNQVLQEVWKARKNRHKHYVHLYMAHLRQKLESDPSNPRHLVTKLGVGYQFQL